MKTCLIACDGDQLNLLFANAIAKPLSQSYHVYLDCPDIFAPLFVNNPNFYGTKESIEYDKVVNLPECKFRSGEPDRTLFQSLFSECGLTWKGEGYDLHFYSRNRQKKNSLGVVIRNRWLKDYIVGNDILKGIRIWNIPFKANVIKQLDEINRSSHIITDDENCVHLALALRKYVEYVVPNKPVYPIEMFGSGNLHIFDYARYSLRGQHAQKNTPKS